MEQTNFRYRVIRVLEEAQFVDARGGVEQGKRVQYVIDYDEGGRTFSDGPFSVRVAATPNWMAEAQRDMEKTRSELEQLRRL